MNAIKNNKFINDATQLIQFEKRALVTASIQRIVSITLLILNERLGFPKLFVVQEEATKTWTTVNTWVII